MRPEKVFTSLATENEWLTGISAVWGDAYDLTDYRLAATEPQWFKNFSDCQVWIQAHKNPHLENSGFLYKIYSTIIWGSSYNGNWHSDNLPQVLNLTVGPLLFIMNEVVRRDPASLWGGSGAPFIRQGHSGWLN